MRRWIRPAVAWPCVGLGLLMLGLNLHGAWRPPEVIETVDGEPRGYRDRIRSVAEQEAELAALLAVPEPGLAEARRLNRLVADRMVHAEYFLQPWDNWYLWLKSAWDPPAQRTFDPELLWRRGQGNCGPAAMVYAHQARRLGFEPRIVWLNGHVIAQVHVTGAGWRAVDPDLDVFWPDTERAIASQLGVDGIAQAIAARGHAPDFARHMAEKYASTDDNTLSFVPHLPEEARAEQRAAIPKWGIPIVLVLIGVGLGARRRSTAPPA